LSTISIHNSDNLAFLKAYNGTPIDLIYIDPPFNTGKVQHRQRMRSIADESGDRTGFAGRRYRTETIESASYDDSFGDDFIAYLRERIELMRDILAPNGSFFLHLDYREVHYAKVMCDEVFGRSCFQNEIIWSYDYGGRPTRKWAPKHDNILWYTRDPENYTFDLDASDRIPYMAPNLVGAEKAARGKIPTDVWWNTIVSPTGKEKTGYPTQKPRTIIDRIVTVHTAPGALCADFFAGSGTLGASCLAHDRDAILVDANLEAIEIMRQRFATEVENVTFTASSLS